jgi:hypothetical protein
MSKILHLLGSDSNVSKLKGTVGLLCEFAPDSPCVQVPEQCYGPDQLLGSADAALQEVYPLVRKVLESAPSIEGFPPLSIFEESLLEQFSYILQTFQLDRWISQEGFTTCRFSTYSPWLDRLRDVQNFTGSEYEIVAELPVFQSSSQRRALRRLWSSRPHTAEFFRRVLPLWSRCLSGLPRRKLAKQLGRGGIWFYSTAYNFTRIGLEYEPYLPEPMRYLVEDPATGGKRLRESARDWHLLYAWAQMSDIPSRFEVRRMAEEFMAAIRGVPLSAKQSGLRSVLLNSEWWQLFLTRRLPFLVFNGRALRRWFESVAPEMIVVGNAGYERALLLQESVRGVPIVMLQHGIMHWVFGVTDEPVDVFLLRGPFFQRSVNEVFRRKTVILNFPETQKIALSQGTNNARNSILYISCPYDVAEFYHREDLRDILRSLLRVSHAAKRPLLIRVHPMEKISTYERTIGELERELGVHAEVHYSQGAGAEGVLARSCVAALHFSTMFLDCLRHGIPIVSFGWHWFANHGQFEEERIFNFARNLQHFERLLHEGIEGKLPVRRAGLEEFLAPSAPDEISSFFRKIRSDWKVSGKTVSHAMAQ